jgi:hypothetical protein
MHRNIWKRAFHAPRQCFRTLWSSSGWTGIRIGTPEGLEIAKTKCLFENICPGIIKSSVEIIDEIISEKNSVS